MHLTPDRLAELGRAQGAPLGKPTPEELAHLAACTECRAGRERDEALDRALRAIPWPAPSASFVAATQARMIAARRAQEVRQRLRAAIASAALMAVVVATTAMVGIVAMKQVVLFLAMRLKGVVIALDLLSKVGSGSAVVPVFVAIVCAASLALSMAVIARLSRAPARIE